MWRLADHVSFCWVEGQAIFLDLSRDRYFALPRGVNKAFCRWSEQRDPALAMPDVLVRHNLVVSSQLDQMPSVLPCTFAAPTKVATQLNPTGGSRWSRNCEAASLLMRMRRRVRTRPLQQLVAEATLSFGDDIGDRALRRLSVNDLALEFGRVRNWFPKHQISCLPDSLALTTFLARHGHATTLVFGVTAQPFGAHCWVQTGATLLNDMLDHVVRYTPILAQCPAATSH